MTLRDRTDREASSKMAFDHQELEVAIFRKKWAPLTAPGKVGHNVVAFNRVAAQSLGVQLQDLNSVVNLRWLALSEADTGGEGRSES